MRKLKRLEPDFHMPPSSKIKLCCAIFFGFVNNQLRSEIPEYQNAKIHDSKEGILFCPDCIMEKLVKNNAG